MSFNSINLSTFGEWLAEAVALYPDLRPQRESADFYSESSGGLTSVLPPHRVTPHGIWTLGFGTSELLPGLRQLPGIKDVDFLYRKGRTYLILASDTASTPTAARRLSALAALKCASRRAFFDEIVVTSSIPRDSEGRVLESALSGPRGRKNHYRVDPGILRPRDLGFPLEGKLERFIDLSEVELNNPHLIGLSGDDTVADEVWAFYQWHKALRATPERNHRNLPFDQLWEEYTDYASILSGVGLDFFTGGKPLFPAVPTHRDWLHLLNELAREMELVKSRMLNVLLGVELNSDEKPRVVKWAKEILYSHFSVKSVQTLIENAFRSGDAFRLAAHILAPQWLALNERWEVLTALDRTSLGGDVSERRRMAKKLLEDYEHLNYADEVLDHFLGLEPFVMEWRDQKQAFSFAYTPYRLLQSVVDGLSLEGKTVIDLGSGNGRLAAFLGMKSAASRIIGIEYSDQRALDSVSAMKSLQLAHVDIRHQDVLDADLSDGDVFFLMNSFPPEVLARVGAQLEALAEKKPIQIVSYSLSNRYLRSRRWLRAEKHFPFGLANPDWEPTVFASGTSPVWFNVVR